MIKKGSPEWFKLIKRLESIKLKSNRDTFCIECWTMLNCKQKVKHSKAHPDHDRSYLTSSQYASES